MSRRKSTVEEQDHMKLAEELRAEMITPKVKKVDSAKAFHKFFIKIKSKLKLGDEMEVVLWKHLQATGNDKPEKFQEGVTSFGYKI